jgi:hypothetical protein
MDVHCSTCGEPWDVYHLRHDAVFDTDLSHDEAQAWGTLSPKARLETRYREKFQAAGWEFGASILDVRHCPCCPKEARINSDKAAAKAALVEILGNDDDGIAATFEDFGL